MFSDTHCHLSHLVERGVNVPELFSSMAAEGYRLAFDIGTKPGDFSSRLERVRTAAAEALRTKGQTGADRIPPSFVPAADSAHVPFRPDSSGLPDFVQFSCGIWPDTEAIADRFNAVKQLADDVAKMKALAQKRDAAHPSFIPLAALGECGLDRYWNGAEAPGRLAALAAQKAADGKDSGSAVSASDDGPGTLDLTGEEELFALQLEIAASEELAVIIHSRDAFEPTLAIIRNSGHSRGVIHCWSYGIAEARAFLDSGYHISFPGNITWPKKAADRERVGELLKFVPRDRLLLETDAPYLTPAPHRGTVNTPYLVRHVYERAAEILEMSQEALSLLVWENAAELFSLLIA